MSHVKTKVYFIFCFRQNAPRGSLNCTFAIGKKKEAAHGITLNYNSRGVKHQTAYPSVKSFDSFLAKKP